MASDRCDLLCLDLPKAEELRARALDGDRAAITAARAKALGDPTRLTIAAALGHRRALRLRPGLGQRAGREPGLASPARAAGSRAGEQPA